MFKKIISCFITLFLVSCANTVDYQTQPLEAMLGKWSSSKEECATKWVEYSLSEDKKTKYLHYNTGKAQSAQILSIGHGEFLIEYKKQPGTQPVLMTNGKPVTWWFVFIDDNTYRMRRGDWSKQGLTAGSWVRCI
ncbi:hypothetical protein N474_01990 [Pseudoalteromonas luteoviolacea CPMOR-2]|uniref:Lipocalin-like domain-containing protein n=1 Tax=Pseudoalteromonas luteoviolacea DSM 6061 TaxID=1365250 RepID=A0A166V2T8_9GAMM|nr:hypothetical protein [Pseudoalteromonas luteoviolacea]KZN31655.1 hypothetical protein N475_04170 [Pseudoalteromonas luteoviolacea DSM 6061]KZN54515.1 hypothetical protein N474_01990 [Pseudoalteromonas luteoviolacea CPMOR-2]MBE0388990.1 hypothetical protein [Pseudoalteromonas luteoviolacea DSM 6061]